MAITGSTGAIFGAMPPAPLLVRAGHWEMALQNAARNGNIAVIANILDNGRVEVDAIYGDYRCTALHCAAAGGKLGSVNQLIQYNADLDIQDAEGATALILAAMNHEIGIVKRLLEAGANTAVVDATGKTALDYANEDNHMELIQCLDGAAAAG